MSKASSSAVTLAKASTSKDLKSKGAPSSTSKAPISMATSPKDKDDEMELIDYDKELVDISKTPAARNAIVEDK